MHIYYVLKNYNNNFMSHNKKRDSDKNAKLVISHMLVAAWRSGCVVDLDQRG